MPKSCFRPVAAFAASLILAAPTSHAATYTLDDAASPISVVFDSSGGRLTVTKKSDGFVWKNPDTSGGSALTLGAVTQADARHLAVNATSGAAALVLSFELKPDTGDLAVAIGGETAAIANGIVYPYPFFPTDGSGFAVVPVDSGYVVPTTATTFSPVGGQRGMEWFGGTDATNTRGWVALVDTPDDYELKVRTGTIAGQTRLGAAPNWRGSNNNAAHTANLVSYERRLRYRFVDSGGYVALAKQFRAFATTLGWVRTLRQKQQDNPALDLDTFVGAPVCYLWGDGRSTALLDAMKNAGFAKALIQVSVNHVDHQRQFPAGGLADGAWFNAVRARGFRGGFYDIYASVRTSGQGGSPYDGFFYLWPPNASTEWQILRSDGTLGPQPTVSAQMAAAFAAGTRLPAHVSRFAMDAYFFDVVCAVDLAEDYDSAHGHLATRTQDRGNRFNLLNTAFANPTKKLLTGTEQGRSWAVPTLHWAEGKFWIGNGASGVDDGDWNDNSYPQIMTDVVEPTSTQLGALMSDGYQAPLWDLVFHDCVVTTVHWHRPHNKYVYLWDHQDRWAMLRGQPPLLNITYAGVQNLAGRQPNSLTDANGTAWSSRWTTMGTRFTQSYTTVGAWAGTVGYAEMIAHERLTSDRSVQASEFSEDGGATGHGIVVNFGAFDGMRGVTGTTWTGTRRGQDLSVPAGEYRTYAWGGLAVNSTPPPAPQAGVAYAHTFTVSGASGNVMWSLASGNPPPGLTLATSGLLSGTPTAPGSHTFSVRATDALGLVATQSFTLTVAAAAAGPTVSALAAIHQHGQTYLTWSEIANTAATYRVYRSTTAFTSTAQLSGENLLGPAAADSSQNVRLSQIRGTNFFFRVTAAGPDLGATQGLYVHTPVADGTGYYAVTAVVDGVEQLALATGESTTAAVVETVAVPEPVMQTTLTIGGRAVEIYAHWASPAGTPYYPAMANQGSVPHNLGLVRRGAAATHSLLVRPHARMGDFLDVTSPTNDAEQWVLALDDWMPNPILNTFWFGYHEGFNLATGQPKPATGVVHDYTARRARWEIEWALRTLPIDTQRVYMTGHSMGAIGSIFLSMTMPGKIAAIWLTSPKYDFGFLNDPNASNIWNDGANERASSGDLMWGTVATNLACSEGLPAYDRLDAGALAQLFKGRDMPVIVAFNGKNDNVVGWAEKIGFYQALNAGRHGGAFFFDSGVHNRSGGEWVPQQNSNVLNRYRLDQSYPAFSNSSANGNPGDGHANSGDTFGTINGNLDWDTATVVDTSIRFEIVVRTTSLANTTGTIAAPAAATADITLRRVQQLPVVPGATFAWKNEPATGGVAVQSGQVTADADGLLTIPAFQITAAGNKLVVEPLAAPPGDARLVNLSARASATDAEPLIGGFVIGGAGTRTVLIRAIGPSLAPFGVAGVLADPRLRLYSGQTVIAENDDWGAAANAAQVATVSQSLGAFDLPAGSKDAVQLVVLAPGAYTAHAVAPAGASGIVLVEIYDAGGTGDTRLINLSSRTHTESGSGTLIVGFVLAGTGTRPVLLRGVGPTLAQFNVGGLLADPRLELFSGSASQAANDNWGEATYAAQTAQFSTQVSAFALPGDSRDAALLLNLGAGAFTAHIQGGSGNVLAEIYAP